jgi:putative sterol carrier protein
MSYWKIPPIFSADGKTRQWTIDLKNGNGSVYEGVAKGGANVTFVIDDENFVKMTKQEVNPTNLFMQGQLKIKGDLGMAMKLEGFLKELGPAAKL